MTIHPFTSMLFIYRFFSSFAFPDKSSVESDVFNQVPDKPIFDDHKPDERDRVEGLDDYNRVTDSTYRYCYCLLLCFR